MKKPSPEKPAITAVEAAQIAGLSRETILLYYKQGKLLGYKKGIGPTSPTMIYLDSFEKFMRARKGGGQPK